jgi:hypothetical protein
MKFTEQLIISIITILCSGLASTVITHQLNNSRLKREFLREKLETLATSVLTMRSILEVTYQTYGGALTGAYTIEEAHAKEEQMRRDSDKDYWLRIQILTKIYFPQLVPPLEKYTIAIELFMKSQIKALASKAKNIGVTTAIQDYESSFSDYSKATKSFCECVYNYAHRVNNSQKNCPAPSIDNDHKIS